MRYLNGNQTMKYARGEIYRRGMPGVGAYNLAILGKGILDPLYQEAVELSSGRTIMTEDNRINIYLIMKYCL